MISDFGIRIWDLGIEGFRDLGINGILLILLILLKTQPFSVGLIHYASDDCVSESSLSNESIKQ